MSVRNLRAMFETKKQESPPERGRSPADSSPGTESPRPLSKVRTSFVAIEKDGRIGLQRNPSQASSLSGRKLSGDTEATSSALQDNIVANASSPAASRPDLGRAPVSVISIGSPQQDPRHSLAGGGTPYTNPPASQNPLASAPSGPTATIGGKQTGLAESPQIKEAAGREKESEAAPSSGDRQHVGKAQSQVAPGQDQGEAGTGREGINGGGVVVPSGIAAVTKSLDGVDKTRMAKPAVETAQMTPKPTAEATQTPIKPAAETAPTAKTATKPAADTTPKTTKAAENTAQKPTNPQPKKPLKSASQPRHAAKTNETTSRRPTTPSADRKTTEKKSAPTRASPEGSVKPRPKSPTRPVKLPAGLTSHTAASGSRTRAASGGGPPSANASTARPGSRTSTALGTTGKGMRRSVSAAGRQRPSLGPPPKLPAKDHPVPKKESKVDEGFLARMMRPTQSYANKVSEKLPTTPPRKTAGATKKPASAKSGSARKPVSRATSAATSSAGSPEADKKSESSAPRSVAPVVKQTPIAEESITIPKRAKADCPAASEKEVATSLPPRTPEHEPTIIEEKEESIADVPMVNGDHKESATVEEEL